MARYETFELNATLPLETYEWDDIWFDHATDTRQKRVIVFGDSITVNYRFSLVEALRGEFCVDNYGTSKAADNPFLKENMRLILAQQKHDIIHFCSGHGTHQSIEQYRENVEALICWLRTDYPEKKLIISSRISSTYPPKIAANLERSSVLRELAEKYNLPFDDLCTITENRPELFKEDKVHLSEAGCEVVAAKVADTIRRVALTGTNEMGEQK